MFIEFYLCKVFIKDWKIISDPFFKEIVLNWAGPFICSFREKIVLIFILLAYLVSCSSFQCFLFLDPLTGVAASVFICFSCFVCATQLWGRSSLTGIELMPSTVAAQSPNHWTTRKFFVMLSSQFLSSLIQ